MDYYIENQIASALLPGERIAWCGKPNRKTVFTQKDIFLIPFSLLWCGFAVFWNVSVWKSGAPLMFRVFGFPFLIVGIYMVFGRFIHASMQKKNTYYALTNLRVVILTRRSTRAQYIRDIPFETVTEHQNGYGTIVFGPDQSFYPYRRPGFQIDLNAGRMAFECIEDAIRVYLEYQKLKQEAQA